MKKEARAQVFSCKSYKIFKNSLFYRTPSVAVSGYRRFKSHGADLSLLNFCVILVEIQFEKHSKTK